MDEIEVMAAEQQRAEEAMALIKEGQRILQEGPGSTARCPHGEAVPSPAPNPGAPRRDFWEAQARRR